MTKIKRFQFISLSNIKITAVDMVESYIKHVTTNEI